MDLTVIICTHNPREDYLRRTLEALKNQTLPKDQWELLVIDNASTDPLAGKWDLSWHPNARYIREETLGLTPARLRGIREAKGELMVFVDDDNLLVPDYLTKARALASTYPFLGVFGGHIEPEFEVPPPGWTIKYWSYLALRSPGKSYWSNSIENAGAFPCGAGMVTRKSEAMAYSNDLIGNKQRRKLDRCGNSTASAGDTDLVMLVCERGLGYGVFPELRLIHLIPKERLDYGYLRRLEKGVIRSNVQLRGFRNQLPKPDWKFQAKQLRELPGVFINGGCTALRRRFIWWKAVQEFATNSEEERPSVR